MSGDRTQTADLCQECFESSAPQESRQISAEVKVAHCQYCGSQPCAGGTDLFAKMAGKKQMLFLCMPCSREFNQFMHRELERIPKGLSQRRQIAAVQAMRDQADRHMKQWTSKRQVS
jgi:DNA-directed RNA polymerase subunit RPC12/RpoP